MNHQVPVLRPRRTTPPTQAVKAANAAGFKGGGLCLVMSYSGMVSLCKVFGIILNQILKVAIYKSVLNTNTKTFMYFPAFNGLSPPKEALCLRSRQFINLL